MEPVWEKVDTKSKSICVRSIRSGKEPLSRAQCWPVAPARCLQGSQLLPGALACPCRPVPHRRIRPLEGCDSKCSAFSACSTPVTGRALGSSSPSCTSTEAWSLQRELWAECQEGGAPLQVVAACPAQQASAQTALHCRQGYAVACPAKARMLGWHAQGARAPLHRRSHGVGTPMQRGRT